MLCASLFLQGCNGGSKTTYNPKVFNDWAISTADYSTLNYLYSFSAVDFQITANIVDGLIEVNKYGEYVPSLAESWNHNEDYTVWTFNIRKGVKWLDSAKKEYAEVKADDFVFSAEYILDPANTSLNVQSYTSMIQGADEYYKAKSEGKDVNFESVGVKAIDEYTVEYTMIKPIPYFESVVTYAAYYPANRQFVNSLGKKDDGTSKFGIDKDHVLSNGPFLIEELVQGNTRKFSKNEQYWDKDNVHFDKVNVVYFKDKDSVYEAFDRGDVSWAPLVTTRAKKMKDDGSKYLVQTELEASTYCLFLNDEVGYSEDTNKAMQNVNFRRSLFYGIDRDLINEIENPIDPKSIEAFSFSGKGFVTAPNGEDYLMLGESAKYQQTQFNLEKAKEYKEKAMAELKEQGVSFPIKLTFATAAGNETKATQGRMLEEAIGVLGEDYVTCENAEYASSSFSQDKLDGKFALYYSGWSPDYADPINNLNCLLSKGTMNNGVERNTVGVSNWDYPEFDQMVLKADQLTDLQERYTAFANCEAWLNDQAYYIPITKKGGTYIVTSINEFTRPNAVTGVDSFKWKGMEGFDHQVSEEEHKQLREEWLEQKAKRKG